MKSYYKKQKETPTMKDKIKASELFVKLVVNSQRSMESEKQKLLKHINENHSDNDNIKCVISDFEMNNEFLRFSIIKTTILTLIEFGIAENDCDIFDETITNRLIKDAFQLMELNENIINNLSE